MDRVSQTEVDLRWGITQRLAFIESRLFWDGGVRRPDIISRFGIAVTQASKDLALYQSRAPDNLRYDGARKCYVATDSFKPLYIDLDADAYLRRQLHSDIGEALVAERLPIPDRRIEPLVLRLVVGAARDAKSVEIHYASSSTGEHGASWRRISPHAFAHDGMRWHARAYCHRNGLFMDFVVSRALAARDYGPAGKSAAEDIPWQTKFDVVLCPNPRLAPSLRQIAADDFGMTHGQVSISIRRAMLYYFSKRLRLDLAEHSKDPREVPVVARNRAALEAAIAKAGAPEPDATIVPFRRGR